MLPLIAAAGASRPSLLTIAHAAWPSLLSDRRDLQQAAYSPDAITLGLVVIEGPILVTVATALGAPAAALTLSIALMTTGVVGILAADVSLPKRVRSGARSPGVRTLSALSFTIGFRFGSLDVILPAFARVPDAASLSGLPFVLWSLGSIAGGLAFGAARTPDRLDRLLLPLAAAPPASIAPRLLADSLLALLGLIVLSGPCISPLQACGNSC